MPAVSILCRTSVLPLFLAPVTAPLRRRLQRALCSTRMAHTGSDDVVRSAVAQIHASAMQAVLYVTGGGSSAISTLLAEPGASRTVLDARVPYSKGAFVDALAGSAVPRSFASEEAAVALARAALKRAVVLAGKGTPVVGVGAACALVTSRERKGRDMAYVAAVTPRGERRYCAALVGERGVQEKMVKDLIVQALADVAGVGVQICDVVGVVEECGDVMGGVLSGDVGFVEVCGERVVGEATCAKVVIPGSFNPVHRGHRGLLKAGVEVVREMKGGDVVGAFEIGVGNADKGVLEREEVERRVRQFEDDICIVSGAMLLVDKANMLPGVAFVVGVDTAERLVMPKYYGGMSAMLTALSGIMVKGCLVLVGARVDKDGTLRTLRDVTIPKELKALFIEIEEFREDISSTELRRKN